MANRSARFYLEPRPAKLSDGTYPLRDVFAMPADVAVFFADSEDQARDLCDSVNYTILQVLGQ